MRSRVPPFSFTPPPFLRVRLPYSLFVRRSGGYAPLLRSLPHRFRTTRSRCAFLYSLHRRIRRLLLVLRARILPRIRFRSTRYATAFARYLYSSFVLSRLDYRLLPPDTAFSRTLVQLLPTFLRFRCIVLYRTEHVLPFLSFLPQFCLLIFVCRCCVIVRCLTAFLRYRLLPRSVHSPPHYVFTCSALRCCSLPFCGVAAFIYTSTWRRYLPTFVVTYTLPDFAALRYVYCVPAVPTFALALPSRSAVYCHLTYYHAAHAALRISFV